MAGLERPFSLVLPTELSQLFQQILHTTRTVQKSINSLMPMRAYIRQLPLLSFRCQAITSYILTNKKTVRVEIQQFSHKK